MNNFYTCRQCKDDQVWADENGVCSCACGNIGYAETFLLTRDVELDSAIQQVKDRLSQESHDDGACVAAEFDYGMELGFIKSDGHWYTNAELYLKAGK